MPGNGTLTAKDAQRAGYLVIFDYGSGTVWSRPFETPATNTGQSQRRQSTVYLGFQGSVDGKIERSFDAMLAS